MWLSRVVVNRNAGLQSLGPLLLPDDDNERVSVGHRMIWSLFPGVDPDQKYEKRMHLWREEALGHYIVLSHRKPTANPLLDVREVKMFEPKLTAGDVLRFRLRVNPTVTTKRAGVGKSNRGKRTDVVMDAIRGHATGARAGPRNEQLGWGEDEAGKPLPLLAPRDWLDRRGAGSGFAVVEAIALEYQTLQVRRRNFRPGNRNAAQIGVVDLDGIVTVTEPARFLERLVRGFGSARAFGCGLMLIRRTV